MVAGFVTRTTWCDLSAWLPAYTFMIPPVRSDYQIHQEVRIGDHPLQLLWVMPTTTAERQYLGEKGMGKFCQLLDQHHHPLVLLLIHTLFFTVTSPLLVIT